jgi:hypothetical protein
VRLQEDVTLAGFLPLKNNAPEPIFCRCDIDIEIAQVSSFSLLFSLLTLLIIGLSWKSVKEEV